MGGTTTGGVRIILRLEGLGVLILALVANSKWGIDWRNFGLFFFAPDLSMLGYFAGPRIGAVAYNSGHSCLGGLVCVALGVLLPVPILLDAGSGHCPLGSAFCRQFQSIMVKWGSRPRRTPSAPLC
jgi:hypothetical protein